MQTLDHVCHENVAHLSRINTPRHRRDFSGFWRLQNFIRGCLESGDLEFERSSLRVSIVQYRAAREQFWYASTTFGRGRADSQNANCRREDVRFANLRALILTSRGWLLASTAPSLTFIF
jgi:hypothetical protein